MGILSTTKVKKMFFYAQRNYEPYCILESRLYKLRTFNRTTRFFSIETE